MRDKQKSAGLFLVLFLMVLFLQWSEAFPQSSESWDVELPAVTLSNIPIDLEIQLNHPLLVGDQVFLEVTGEGVVPIFYTATVTEDGFRVVFEDLLLEGYGKLPLKFWVGPNQIPKTILLIPGVLSLLPSIIAIILAFITRQVILSLLFGVWIGAFFIYDFNPFISIYRLVDTFLLGALYNEDHLMILLFSLMLGGMVGLISRSGGTYGIVNLVAKFAKSPRSGQIVTWLMGMLIFFDDYSNTLLVGNTMRAFTDKLRISREKLSYIVDSTAAPVASIAVVTTWIGTEIGLINDLNLPNVDGFQTFLHALPYNFYPILALIMVFLVAVLRRDYGPMFRAEQRSWNTGKVVSETAVPLVDSSFNIMNPAEDIKPKWYNAMIPILSVIVTIMVGLYIDGQAALGDSPQNTSLRHIFGAANSLKVLMWGSFTGVIVSALVITLQRLLGLREMIDAWLTGLKSMTVALIILVMAWSLTSICTELKTASFIAYTTKDLLSAHWLPMMTFLIAAFIGFATGTSWGTMGILIPIVLPLTMRLTEAQSLPVIVSESVFYSTVAAILSGSVFGDHCSPISDTTIMSSMASGADHIDHVRTQLPYAALAAVVACVMGYLPAGYGISPSISFLIAISFIFIFLKLFGKDPFVLLVEPDKPSEASSSA